MLKYPIYFICKVFELSHLQSNAKEKRVADRSRGSGNIWKILPLSELTFLVGKKRTNVQNRYEGRIFTNCFYPDVLRIFPDFNKNVFY